MWSWAHARHFKVLMMSPTFSQMTSKTLGQISMSLSVSRISWFVRSCLYTSEHVRSPGLPAGGQHHSACFHFHAPFMSTHLQPLAHPHFQGTFSESGVHNRKSDSDSLLVEYGSDSPRRCGHWTQSPAYSGASHAHPQLPALPATMNFQVLELGEQTLRDEI